MNFFDLLRLIFENLSRRKGRVALTAIGVVIGTAAVVVLVSLALGLQRSATSQFGSIAELTRITVNPNYGDSGPMMVEKAMGGGGGGGGGSSGTPANQMLLTPDAIEGLKALPGVDVVIPREWMQAEANFFFGKLQNYASIMGVGTNDLSVFGYETQSGVLTLDRGTVVVGQGWIRNFFDPTVRPGQDQPAAPELQDQELRLVVTKWVQDASGNMTPVKKTYRYRVVGIIPETRGEPDYMVYMPISDVVAVNEWVQGQRINRAKVGYNEVIVLAEDRSQVVALAQTITDMGYYASTPEQFVQGINSFFLVLQVIFGGVGAVALLVAAIGIANTMTMAILERTREIGLMKAVGATNRDVLSIFLGEAAGIGFIGGLGGVLVGWGSGALIQILATAYLAGSTQPGMGGTTSINIYTPAWLPVFALIFATLVGLLSGLYPALRAAILVPVTALKYE